MSTPFSGPVSNADAEARGQNPGRSRNMTAGQGAAPGRARQREASGAARAERRPLPDDGTRQLLRGGLSILAAGIVATLLARYVFGGIGIHGPHTSAGWLALIVALMCLPFGLMLLALGGAKYLRNRRDARG